MSEPSQQLGKLLVLAPSPLKLTLCAEFVEQYVGKFPNESVIFKTIVQVDVAKGGTFLKKMKVETQPRILVVGTNRIFLFTPGKELAKEKKVCPR